MLKPTFSLIVPTINRDKLLHTLLQSLEAQTFKDFEVLIVDQNADNRVEPVIKEFASRLRIIHVRQLERGASRARNAGLKKAQGEIVTFPDDDCEYPSDLLENVLKIFREHPEFSGITLSSTDKNSDGKIARLSKTKGRLTKLNILPRTIEFTIFVRSSIIHNFFFDEELGVGADTPWWSDEGPDFVLRLMNKGKIFSYFPDLIIYHPRPFMAYDEKAFTRAYKYGCGRGRYLKKHRYPLWFVLYTWGLYVAGIVIGSLQLNGGKIKYYFSGLKGRVRGYVS